LQGKSVTEVDWLSCTDPERLLEFLRGKASERKLRLFACACCRRVWPMLRPNQQHAVEMAEKFADGSADLRDLIAARTVALAASHEAPPGEAVIHQRATQAQWAAYWTCNKHPAEIILDACAAAADAAADAATWWRATDALSSSPTADQLAAWDEARLAAGAEQATLLRHLVGNPFQPPSQGDWSGQIVQLAEALYAGGDCAFALHDALLEAGRAELAGHFSERDHPKGCWALDLVLGRE
jgi:hypothetical protein